MATPPAGLIDRALELGALGSPADSPVVLARARLYKEYFDRLVTDSKSTTVVRRRLMACLRGRLVQQLAHDRARRLVLVLVDENSGASAEELLAAIRAEESAREFAQWGRALEYRERLALAGLATPALHKELSALIQDELLQVRQDGISSTAAVRRRCCAWLFVLVIVVIMAIVWTAVQGAARVFPWYSAVHVVGTAVLAWWLSRDLFEAARSAENAVRAANGALRPKPLQSRRPS